MLVLLSSRLGSVSRIRGISGSIGLIVFVALGRITCGRASRLIRATQGHDCCRLSIACSAERVAACLAIGHLKRKR